MSGLRANFTPQTGFIKERPDPPAYETDVVTEDDTFVDSPSTNELFAEALVNYTRSENVQHGIVAIFDRLTELLPTRRFSDCDEILSSLDVTAVHLRLLLALLKGTARVPENELPSRKNVLARAIDRLKRERETTEANAILSRLQ